MSGIEIKATRFGAPVAQRLLGDAIAELTRRYGGDGDGTPIAGIEFDPPDGGFFIAYSDGVPVGCGGWRSYAGSDQIAEVKRVYVGDEARGKGIARALMSTLESDAREHGRTRMILETGAAQPEAIAMYHALGYLRIPDFGHYKDEPDVHSFGRDL